VIAGRRAHVFVGKWPNSLLAILIFALSFVGTVHAQDEDPSGNSGRIATLTTSDLRDFEAQPPAVRRLLAEALRLTTLNLSYKYGSSDPAVGGMDCSGTIHYLLVWAGIADARAIQVRFTVGLGPRGMWSRLSAPIPRPSNCRD